MNRSHRWFALPCAFLAMLLVWLGAGPAGGQPGKDEKTTTSKPVPWTFKEVEVKPADKKEAFVKKLTEEGIAFTHAKPTTVKEANPVLRVNLSGKVVKDAKMAELAKLVQKGEELGIDFRDVKELVLSHTSVTDAGMKQLQHLPDLERFHLHTNAGITDAGLEAVGKLTKLKELTLHQDNITNEGLKHLHGLKSLDILKMDHTKVTDAGLKSLGHLHLTRLEIPPAAKTEHGLKDYLAVVELEHKHTADARLKAPLDLTGWHLTPASVPAIQEVVGKHELPGVLVSGKSITDEWLAALAKGLPQLEVLTLSHTALTDKGLGGHQGDETAGPDLECGRHLGRGVGPHPGDAAGGERRSEPGRDQGHEGRGEAVPGQAPEVVRPPVGIARQGSGGFNRQSTGAGRDRPPGTRNFTPEGAAVAHGEGLAGVQDGAAGGGVGPPPEGSDGEPLRKLAAYVAPHPTHLGYADRLAEGRSIGRGQVEGAIELLVNRRRKRTGARWRPEHVGPLVELVALVDSPDWHDIWTAA